MDALFVLLIVAFFVWTLFYLRDLRKRRDRLHAEDRIDGIHWAERYYLDSQTKTVAARFVMILESQIHVPLERIFPTTRFFEDLEIDDIELIEILMAVEKDFHVTITEEDATRITMINDMVDYLKDK